MRMMPCAAPIRAALTSIYTAKQTCAQEFDASLAVLDTRCFGVGVSAAMCAEAD